MTSIDGDPARYQRYQDVRDGLLFSGFRYAFAQPDGNYTFKARANNVGWRDQEYFADYNRAGKLSVTGGYQQIPQFYSVDTMTPYTGSGGTLLLDDAAQRAAQDGSGPQPLRPDRAAVRSARAARHRARRRRGHADAEARRHGQLHHAEARRRAAVGRQLRLQQRRRGAAALRVADQRLHDRHRVDEHEEHAARRLQRIVVRQSRAHARLGQPAAPRRRVGRAGTRPHVAVAVQLRADDQLRRLHQAGAQDAGHRLLLLRLVEQQRAAAAVHDQFGAADDCAAARQRGGRGARVLDQPEPDVAPHRPTGGSARASAITPTPTTCRRRASRSTSPTTRACRRRPTGGPDLYAHDRTTFDADATWDKLKPLALTVGYTHNANGYDARTFKSSGEDVFRVSADAVGTSWATFRVQYEVGSRTGSGLDENAADRHRRAPGDAVLRPGRPDEKPLHAGRSTSSRRTSGCSASPADSCTTTTATRCSGCRSRTGSTFSLAADYHLPNGLGAGATYNFERYTGLQQSHEGDSSDAQFNDPLRNWTSDSTETVNYFSIYATPPRIGRNTEVRFSYDFSHAIGDNLYTIPAGSPITAPNQLPEVFNKLQQLHIDARHRITKNLAATFSYLYEPLNIYDYAFDPSVVNGIVQPSSLVMGYVYRPYTANSFTFGLRYLW